MEKYRLTYLGEESRKKLPDACIAIKTEQKLQLENFESSRLSADALRSIPEITKKLSNPVTSCAMWNLAVCYDLGIDCTQSLDDAKFFYRLSYLQEKIDNGEIDAIKQMGAPTAINLLMEAQAFEYAANLYYPAALYYKGICYYQGLGVSENDKMANHFFEIALNKGCYKAAALLANSYMFGHGVSKDELKAIEYYRIAAEHGDDDAAINLSAVYAERKEFQKAFSVLNMFVNKENDEEKRARVLKVRTLVKETAQKYREECRGKYRMQGLCQYCGGTFKGFFSPKCSNCNRPKDY